MEDLIISSDGTQNWYLEDYRHRDNDLPAIIYPDGTQFWFQNNELCRDNDLPAVIRPNGEEEWRQNGERHRDGDHPAVIYPDGTQEWYQNGKLHRNGDQPAVIVAKNYSYLVDWNREDEVTNMLIWYNHGKEISRKECTEELYNIYCYDPNRPDSQVQFVDLEIEMI